MTDDEFLSYCTTHAETPRCGFTPDNLARLCRLARADIFERLFAAMPAQVVDCTREGILSLVAQARAAMIDGDVDPPLVAVPLPILKRLMRASFNVGDFAAPADENALDGDWTMGRRHAKAARDAYDAAHAFWASSRIRDAHGAFDPDAED